MPVSKVGKRRGRSRTRKSGSNSAKAVAAPTSVIISKTVNKMPASKVGKRRGRSRTRKPTPNSAKSVASLTSVIISNETCGESSRKPKAGENLLQKSISETCLLVKDILMVKQSRIKELEDQLNEQRKSNTCLQALSKNLQCQVEQKDQQLKEIVQERTDRLKTLAEKLNLDIETEREIKDDYASKVENLEELVKSLREEVKNQECSRKDLQQVNEESRANFKSVNEELKETILAQQKTQKEELLMLKMAIEEKEKNLLEKENTLSEEREHVEQQKKYIETVESDLNRKKEEIGKWRGELEKKNLEINILNSDLKEEKQTVFKSNNDLEDCRSKVNYMSVGIKSLELERDEYLKKESILIEAVKSGEKTIERLRIDMKNQEDMIASLNQDHDHHVSLMIKKEECIKNLQQKLKEAEILCTVKDNQKRVDKPKDKSSNISTSGGKLVASLDKAMPTLRSRQLKAKNLPRMGDRVDVEMETDMVDGSVENRKEGEEDHGLPSTSGEIREVMDTSKVLNLKKRRTISPTSPPPDPQRAPTSPTHSLTLPRAPTSPTPSLSLPRAPTSPTHSQTLPCAPTSPTPPDVSDSPAQTGQKAKTLVIKVRDLDTMLPFTSPDLVIPPPVTVSDVGDIIPVDMDMDIITDQEVVHLKIQEEETKERLLDSEKKLKYDVTDVVKALLKKRYYVRPHQSVPPGKGFLIHSSEDFSELAKRFSLQFREEIIRELTNSSVDGIGVSLHHKRAMAEQIHFYFEVRKEVHLRLERVLFGCFDPEFSTSLRQFTENLWRELTDSHLTRMGSLQGLVMTEDVRLDQEHGGEGSEAKKLQPGGPVVKGQESDNI